MAKTEEEIRRFLAGDQQRRVGDPGFNEARAVPADPSLVASIQERRSGPRTEQEIRDLLERDDDRPGIARGPSLLQRAGARLRSTLGRRERRPVSPDLTADATAVALPTTRPQPAADALGDLKQTRVSPDLAADATRVARPPEPTGSTALDLMREKIRADRDNTVNLRNATIARTPPAVEAPEGERERLGEQMRRVVEQGREFNRRLGLRDPQFGDAPPPDMELTGALKPDLPLSTEMARTAKRFGGQVTEGVGGTLQAVGQVVPPLKRPGRSMSSAGQEIQERNPPSLSVQAGGAFDPSNPRWWLARGGEGFLQLGSQVGLALAVPGSPALRLAAFAAPNLVLEGGGSFEETKAMALRQGASAEEAERTAAGVAAVVGLGSAALEAIPGAVILFDRVPGAQAFFRSKFMELIPNVARRAGSGLIAEGVTEAVQEAFQATTQFVATKDPEALRDIGERMKGAGAIGVLVGSVAGASAAGASSRRDDVQIPQERTDKITIGPEVKLDDSGVPIESIPQERTDKITIGPEVKLDDSGVPIESIPQDDALPGAEAIGPRAGEVASDDVRPAGAGAVFEKATQIAKSLTDEELAARYRATLRQSAETEAEANEAGPGIRVFDNAGIKGVAGTGKGSFARGRLRQAGHRRVAYENELRRREIELPDFDDAYRYVRAENVPVGVRAEFLELSDLTDSEVIERLVRAEVEALSDLGSTTAAVRRTLYAGEARARGIDEEVPAASGDISDDFGGPAGTQFYPAPTATGTASSVPTSARIVPPTDPLVDEDERVTIYPSLKGRLTPAVDVAASGPVSAPAVIGAMAKITEAAGRALPLRSGRIGQRRALGIFKVRPEVIRTREANDIPTAAHEVAHAIEKVIYGWPKGGPWKGSIAGVTGKMQRELRQLGFRLYGESKPVGGYKREGFAEFVRAWITSDEESLRVAPTFAEWFDGSFLAGQPKVRKAMESARDATTRYGDQGSRQRAVASMADTGSLRERIGRAGKGVRRFFSMENLVDMAQPIAEFSAEAQRKLERPLAPSQDPSLTLSALRTTHTARTRYMVENAMIDLAGNKVGQPLNSIEAMIRPLEREDFTIYLWARRARALWNDPQGARNPGLSLIDAEQIISELENPRFAQGAQIVYEWNDGVLNYAAQASPSFRQIVSKVRERDPGDYVPLQRMFDEIDDLWGRAAQKGGATTRSPVKRLKGSGRRIKDPFPVMISQASSTLRAAHHRMVIDQIIRLSSIEGMGGLIEEVPPEMVPGATRTIGQLLDQLKKRLAREGVGLETDPKGPVNDETLEVFNEAVTFFVPKDRPSGADPIVPLWDGEKIRWFQVDAKLFDALSALDVYRLPQVAGLGILEATLGKSAEIFRAGTVGLRASFGLLWNPIRDAQTMWVNTQTSAAGPRLLATWLGAMTDAALDRTVGRRSEYLDAFVRLGGEMAQPLGQDLPQASRAARRLFHGRTARTLDPRNWFDWYRDLVQAPESAPRVAELKLLSAEIGWQPGEPMTVDQSFRLLLAAKQVTTDFTAAGEFSRFVNRMVPFHNAAIQGPRANLRAGKRNPQKFALRGLQLTAATMLLWWRNKDEEWWKEMDLREKFLHWHFSVTLPDGREEIVRIPRGFEVGLVFSAFPEMLLDAWHSKDPKSVIAFMKVAFQTMMPPLTPPGLEEIYEQGANRDTFFDTPIVPRGQQNLPAEEQFNEFTSRAAITMGQIFKVSPRRIDHGIRGMFGPVGSDLVELVGLGAAGIERENELADTPIFGRLFVRGGTTRSRSIDELYDALEAARKTQYSNVREENAIQRQQRLLLEDASKAVTALSYVRRFTPSVLDRRTLSTEANALARAALQEIGEEGRPARGPFRVGRIQAETRRERTRREQERERTPNRTDRFGALPDGDPLAGYTPDWRETSGQQAGTGGANRVGQLLFLDAQQRQRDVRQDTTRRRSER